MLNVLNWLTKAPFYRLLIGAIVLFVLITLLEGAGYWLGGISAVLYLFLLGYASFTKNV